MTDEPEIAASWVAIDALAPWADNPRINDAAVDKVAASIKRFGFGAPIVAREADGMVIAGHTRLKAARALGLDRVPVRYLDLDPADAKMLAISDNRVGEEASWDDDVLGAVLRTFDLDLDLGPLGFDDDELAALLSDPLAPGPPADYDAPEVQEGPPDSVLGGVYELGPHRLVCGDCTDEAVWDALLGGERAGILVADPPYVLQASNDKAAKVDQNDQGLEHLLRAVWRCAKAKLLNSAGCVWFGNWRTIGVIRRAVWSRDLKSFQAAVWAKGKGACPGTPWTNDFEMALFFGLPDFNHKIGAGSNVLDVPWPGGRRANHPAEKPVGLMREVMRVSPAADLLVDPFAGSGTTLMACAQESRVARCIELDPRYCDVIRRRWTRYATEHGLDPGPGALA